MRVKKSFLFIVFYFIVSSGVSAQEIYLNFKCNLNSQFVYLLIQKGNELVKVDSTLIINNKVKYNSSKLVKGVYYLQINDTNKMDFIYNPTELKIAFEFGDCKLIKSVKVIESEENKLFWNYKYFSKDINDKIKQERIFQSNIPKSDNAMRAISEEKVGALNAKKINYLNNIVKSNPNLFFSESALLFEKLNIGYADKKTGQDSLLKMIPFSKVEYIHTQFFPSATMLFLQKYTDYDEQGFKNAVDRILNAAKVNDEVYKFHLKFLLDLFKRVGPDVIFDYLIENYLLNGSCSSDEVKNDYSKLLNDYQSVQPGSKAPDFIIRSGSDDYNLNSLISKMKNDEMVFFFYSSHCEFCHIAIEEIEKRPEEYKNLDFVFISLDNELQPWKDFVSEHNKLQGVHLCDLKSWKSDVAIKYMVHKTPTFYKINKQGIILYKGSVLKELINK